MVVQNTLYIPTNNNYRYKKFAQKLLCYEPFPLFWFFSERVSSKDYNWGLVF